MVRVGMRAAPRVSLEALVSLIRIAENTRDIRDALRKEKA